MAPTISGLQRTPSTHLDNIVARASNPNNAPLTSIFAVIVYRTQNVARSASNALARSLAYRSADRSAAALTKLTAIKRQEQILVIPTTYANLRSSPSPGAVVGITLGAVFGFLLALLLIVLGFRYLYGGSTEIIEEELVTRRSRRSHSKSFKKPSPSESSASELPPIPEPEVIVVEERRSSRASRRESRRTSRMSRRTPEEVIVEEELSSVHEPPDEVIVEEEQSDVHTAEEAVVVEEEEEDIVEVIEEHSPEPPPRRRSSARRSTTFRTIDPAEYGGGDAPSRRISRNTNRS